MANETNEATRISFLILFNYEDRIYDKFLTEHAIKLNKFYFNYDNKKTVNYLKSCQSFEIEINFDSF
jgi:hypothetical protein